MIKKKIIIFKGKLFFKETFETFPRCIITEFECRVDVQNHEWNTIYSVKPPYIAG